MQPKASLLYNTGSHDHSRLIKIYLKDANRFDCAVAFAKWSGFSLIKDTLVQRLEAGMKARLIVGLDFYQSEPKVLDALLKLKRAYDIGVFVGAGQGYCTFHPKIYRFDLGGKIVLVVGSANLTQGGLQDNHEVSAVLRRKTDHEFLGYLDDLVDAEEVEELTEVRLTSYREKYEAYRVLQKVAKNEIEHTLSKKTPGIEALGQVLTKMREGGQTSPFANQLHDREKRRKRARAILAKIKNNPGLSRSSFLLLYEELARKGWYSGGLERGKTRIAENFRGFQLIIRSAAEQHTGQVAEVFQSIHVLATKLSGVGPNVLTEILQTYDNKRYAVMNQNSVAGMRAAGYFDFPEKPNRTNVNEQVYKQFCQTARIIQKQLKLSDLTQLDMVFDYAYHWSEPSN